MKRATFSALAVCLLGLVGMGNAAAEDKAATRELPAALRALNLGETPIVSQAEAHQIRGEGFPSYYVEGWIFVNNANTRGVLYMRSFQPISVTVLMTRYQFAVRAFPY